MSAMKTLTTSEFIKTGLEAIVWRGTGECIVGKGTINLECGSCNRPLVKNGSEQPEAIVLKCVDCNTYNYYEPQS